MQIHMHGRQNNKNPTADRMQPPKIMSPRGGESNRGNNQNNERNHQNPF